MAKHKFTEEELKKGQFNSITGKIAGQRSSFNRKASLTKALESIYSDEFDLFLKDLPDKTRYQKKLIRDCLDLSLISKALAGDVSAHKEINDRVDGKAHQSIDLDLSVETIDLSGLTKKQIRQLAEKHLKK